MNRSNAPDTVESRTIGSCMQTNADDIIDLISGDPDRNILKKDDLKDVLSLVTGDSVTFRRDQLDGSPDIVSKWVKTGENSVYLSSMGTAESSYLVDKAVLPIRVEVNEGKKTKKLFVEG